MSKTVFLFSGQGSQYTSMWKALCERFPSCEIIFETANDVLGYDLKEVCFNGPDEKLSQTIYSQPAILAVSLCAFYAAKESGIEYSAVCGHSLGEYAAMVAAGILTVKDAFKAIKIRSEAMQKASEEKEGAMCAVIGLSASEVEKVCQETQGYVIPVNYNSSVQTVIAGEKEAVDKAIETFTGMKARAIKLAVSSAFHSDFMKSASEEFYDKTNDIEFHAPLVDFYCNITGKIIDEEIDMRKYLASHIISPVRFTDELININENGYDKFVELGPNKVLTGLVKKTLKGVTSVNIENNSSLDKALSSLYSQ